MAAHQPMHHDDMRRLERERDTCDTADSFERVTVSTKLTDDDNAFIAGCSMLFLVTAHAEGQSE